MRKSFKKLFVALLLVCAILVVNNGTRAFAASDVFLTGYKWNKTTITYYIDRTPTSSDLAVWIPNFVDAIVSAATLWNIYLADYGTGIQFSRVTSESSADILIKFGNSGVGTDARVEPTQTSGTEYRKVTMTVKDYNLKDYDGGHVYEIFKHEFGHTIGLRDINDSLRTLSIMVNDLDSDYHATYPTYEFDRLNLLKMYKK